MSTVLTQEEILEEAGQKSVVIISRKNNTLNSVLSHENHNSHSNLVSFFV